MKVFLDANVLFSAALDESGMERLVQVLKAEHRVFTSDFAREEASRNILAKRPEWRKAFESVLEGIEVVQSVDKPLPVEIDRKDRPILATALRQRCDYLVTGDMRHFAHLFDEPIGSLQVVSPMMLAKLLG